MPRKTEVSSLPPTMALLMTAAIARTMTRATVLSGKFRQGVAGNHFHVLLNRCALRLEHPQSGALQVVECARSYSTDNDSVNLLSGERLQRVAGAVRMVLIRIGDNC